MASVVEVQTDTIDSNRSGAAASEETRSQALANLEDAVDDLRGTVVQQGIRRLRNMIAESSAKRRTPIIVMPADADISHVPYTGIVTDDLDALPINIRDETIAAMKKGIEEARKVSNRVFTGVQDASDARAIPIHIYHLPPFEKTVAAREGVTVKFSNEERIRDAIRHDQEANPNYGVFAVPGGMFEKKADFHAMMKRLDNLPVSPVVFTYGARVPDREVAADISENRPTWDFFRPFQLGLDILAETKTIRSAPAAASDKILQAARRIMRLVLEEEAPYAAHFLEFQPPELCEVVPMPQACQA